MGIGCRIATEREQTEWSTPGTTRLRVTLAHVLQIIEEGVQALIASCGRRGDGIILSFLFCPIIGLLYHQGELNRPSATHQ